METIDLSKYWDEVQRVGNGRESVDKKLGVKDQRVVAWDISLMGAAGECAVALWCGLYDQWRASAVQGTPQSQKTDVGRFHVRSAAPGRGLLVKTRDVEGAYVLVHVRSKTAKIAGWRFAFECKKEEFWRSDIPKPAFIVPHERLYGLESLSNWNLSHEVPQNGVTGLL